MANGQTVNLKVVEQVADALGELNSEVVYVGGAIVSLYASEEGAEQPRPTMDIDISVQISSYSQMDKLRERLAIKNIHPAATQPVMYRFAFKEILIDFIPFEETALGPTNRWLKPGFAKSYPVRIGDNKIRILPVSLFVATKWEAFKNRGGDPRMSPDFEDIIFVIENNHGFVLDVLNAEVDVKRFLIEMSH
jgi:predicted nucleotidyltransferase